MSKIQIDVDEVLAMLALKKKINSQNLEDIEWVKDGVGAVGNKLTKNYQ